MRKKIKILPGGPYEVSSDIPVKQNIIEIDEEGTSVAWKEGKEYPTVTEEETYHLCRCGHSKNKPFCDGTHQEIGFEGKERASKESYLAGCKVYEGEDLVLYDNEGYCASMRFCDRGVGVWQAAMTSGNSDNKELAIEETHACASGRLSVAEKDGTLIEPELPQEIGLVEDTAAGRRGPLAVKGGITLEGADGEVYEKRNRMTLCRCGKSKNMPFCDISHMIVDEMKDFDK